MDNCIFCKIIKGEIPCYKIYENENVIAFLDASKDVYGHTLVLPKKHYKNILDISKEELIYITSAIKKISDHYVKNCNFEGINIFNNNEECAGQSVRHLHFHIIPRKKDDGVRLFTEGHETDIDLASVQNNLKIN